MASLSEGWEPGETTGADCNCGPGKAGTIARRGRQRSRRVFDVTALDAGAGTTTTVESDAIPLNGGNAIYAVMTVLNSVSMTNVKLQTQESNDLESWTTTTDRLTVSSTCKLDSVTVTGVLSRFVRFRVVLTGSTGTRALVTVDVTAGRA